MRFYDPSLTAGVSNNYQSVRDLAKISKTPAYMQGKDVVTPNGCAVKPMQPRDFVHGKKPLGCADDALILRQQDKQL